MRQLFFAFCLLSIGISQPVFPCAHNLRLDAIGSVGFTEITKDGYRVVQGLSGELTPDAKYAVKLYVIRKDDKCEVKPLALDSKDSKRLKEISEQTETVYERVPNTTRGINDARASVVSVKIGDHKIDYSIYPREDTPKDELGKQFTKIAKDLEIHEDPRHKMNEKLQKILMSGKYAVVAVKITPNKMKKNEMGTDTGTNTDIDPRADNDKAISIGIQFSCTPADESDDEKKITEGLRKKGFSIQQAIYFQRLFEQHLLQLYISSAESNAFSLESLSYNQIKVGMGLLGSLKMQTDEWRYLNMPLGINVLPITLNFKDNDDANYTLNLNYGEEVKVFPKFKLGENKQGAILYRGATLEDAIKNWFNWFSKQKKQIEKAEFQILVDLHSRNLHVTQTLQDSPIRYYGGFNRYYDINRLDPVDFPHWVIERAAYLKSRGKVLSFRSAGTQGYWKKVYRILEGASPKDVGFTTKEAHAKKFYQKAVLNYAILLAEEMKEGSAEGIKEAKALAITLGKTIGKSAEQTEAAAQKLTKNKKALLSGKKLMEFKNLLMDQSNLRRLHQVDEWYKKLEKLKKDYPEILKDQPLPNRGSVLKAIYERQLAQARKGTPFSFYDFESLLSLGLEAYKNDTTEIRNSKFLGPLLGYYLKDASAILHKEAKKKNKDFILRGFSIDLKLEDTLKILVGLVNEKIITPTELAKVEGFNEFMGNLKLLYQYAQETFTKIPAELKDSVGFERKNLSKFKDELKAIEQLTGIFSGATSIGEAKANALQIQQLRIQLKKDPQNETVKQLIQTLEQAEKLRAKLLKDLNQRDILDAIERLLTAIEKKKYEGFFTPKEVAERYLTAITKLKIIGRQIDILTKTK